MEQILFNVVAIVFLVFMLVKSAEFVSEAFVFLAKRLGISEFLAGFIILGCITSLPETSIAINAVRDGVAELSIGNLLGGSLIMITLIIGLNAYLENGLPFRGKYGRLEIIMTLAVIVLPVIALADQNLSGSEGVIMILAYLGLALRLREIFKTRPHKATSKTPEIHLNNPAMTLVKTIAGVSGLIICSGLAVDLAVSTATQLGVNITIIGLFVFAIGSNMPEFAVLLKARGNKEREVFAVGNFLGSAAVNTLIIGGIGLARPMNIVSLPELIPVMILLGFAAILFLWFEGSKNKISRSEGLILISIYAALIIVEVLYRILL